MSSSGGYVQNTDPVTGWTGWVVFAAVFMIIVGSLYTIQGLGAILRDEAYWLTLSGDVLIFDTTTWGWIHLVLGLAMIAVGAMLMRGSTFARVIAIALVGVNLIAQFTSERYPVLGADPDCGRHRHPLCAGDPRRRTQVLTASLDAVRVGSDVVVVAMPDAARVLQVAEPGASTSE